MTHNYVIFSGKEYFLRWKIGQEEREVDLGKEKIDLARPGKKLNSIMSHKL